MNTDVTRYSFFVMFFFSFFPFVDWFTDWSLLEKSYFNAAILSKVISN